VLVGCCVGVGDNVKGGIKDNGGDGRAGRRVHEKLFEGGQSKLLQVLYRVTHVSSSSCKAANMVGGKRALGASARVMNDDGDEVVRSAACTRMQSRVGSLFSHTCTLHTLQTAIMIRCVSRDGWMDPLGRDVKKENETWDGVVPCLGSRIRVVARRTRTRMVSMTEQFRGRGRG
jgi:hypothetical protein